MAIKKIVIVLLTYWFFTLISGRLPIAAQAADNNITDLGVKKLYSFGGKSPYERLEQQETYQAPAGYPSRFLFDERGNQLDLERYDEEGIIGVDASDHQFLSYGIDPISLFALVRSFDSKSLQEIVKIWLEGKNVQVQTLNDQYYMTKIPDFSAGSPDYDGGKQTVYEKISLESERPGESFLIHPELLKVTESFGLSSVWKKFVLYLRRKNIYGVDVITMNRKNAASSIEEAVIYQTGDGYDWYILVVDQRFIHKLLQTVNEDGSVPLPEWVQDAKDNPLSASGTEKSGEEKDDPIKKIYEKTIGLLTGKSGDDEKKEAKIWEDRLTEQFPIEYFTQTVIKDRGEDFLWDINPDRREVKVDLSSFLQ